MAQGKYMRRKKRNQPQINGMILILAGLLIFLGIMLGIKSCTNDQSNPNPPAVSGEDTRPSQSSKPTNGGQATQNNTEGTTAPTEPYVTSTASIGVTGDVLVHGPVIQAAKESDGSYDFTSMYEYIAPYFKEYDLMVANLEVTLGGKAAGPYQGYPAFNCPDSMVDALKSAGVDMMLTANNHSYDTHYDGFIRTQNVLNEKNMAYLGTQLTAEDKDYVVRDINGIKVGMVCYTYETAPTEDGRKTLNGIPLAEKACDLVTSFSYDDLASFYAELETTLKAMETEGAEATIVFIHWGNEYELRPNANQKAIAQKLCDLGVDVIVGGHPHVLQPFTTLTSPTGEKTYCLYSIGNCLSNQRRESLTDVANENYTEDGAIFGVEFEKWNDGTVKISAIDLLPTWVYRSESGGRRVYSVIPLDTTVEDWSIYGVPMSRLRSSYQQTMSILGEGINACREALTLPALALNVE